MSVKPSVPRTLAQVTLRVVSAIMAIIGGLMVVGAILVFLYRHQLGFSEDSMWTIFAYGGIILASAALLLLTARLGLRAADDSSKVGPYRALCYFVGLVILVAIVWGWGMGMFILFNPVVLVSTVTYVLVCSQLADKVADEHERGVVGETFLRTGRQRTLHLLSEVMIVKGAVVGLMAAVMALAFYSMGDISLAASLGVSVADLEKDLIENAVAAALHLGVGALGIWGSNRPEKIMPFFVLSAGAFALDVARIVTGVVASGALLATGTDTLLDLVYTGSCAWLAWKVWRQPRELVDKGLIARQ